AWSFCPRRGLLWKAEIIISGRDRRKKSRGGYSMGIPDLPTLPDWAIVPPPRGSEWTSGNSSPYGEAALADECRKVATALHGTRNEQLNKSTFALAQLVAGGEMDEIEARRRLEGAAIASGLDP